MGNGLKLTQSRFVNIEGHYGFDQNALAGRWSRYNVDRSCGIAALANLISYGMEHFAMSRGESLELMDRIIFYAPPRPWGIARPGILIGALKAMALPFSPDILSGKISGKKALPFIEKHLAQDRPVALLNTNHPHKAFRYHWVTITELLEEEGVLMVRFSSWGGRYKLPYDLLLSDTTVYRALVALVPRKEQ